MEDGLLNAALTAGLDEHEGKATIRSGIEGGIKEPRDPKLNALKREDARAMADRPWPEPDLSLLEPERDAPPLLAPRAIFGPAGERGSKRAAEGKAAPVDYVAGALMAVAGSLDRERALGATLWGLEGATDLLGHAGREIPAPARAPLSMPFARPCRTVADRTAVGC